MIVRSGALTVENVRAIARGLAGAEFDGRRLFKTASSRMLYLVILVNSDGIDKFGVVDHCSFAAGPMMSKSGPWST